MGLFSEYLDMNLDFQQLQAERQKQLRRIIDKRKRDVLVYASNLIGPVQLVGINYPDLVRIKDQLSNLRGDKLDLILETPGGAGEVAEDMVKLLRQKYAEVAIIVPGTAKSAGTIIAMSGDEILMNPSSSLGPIDAQISWQGKHFSAEALLAGIEAIKAEVEKSKGNLNRAYVPILLNISPGEIEHARNAMKFAQTLVCQWLVKYKFKNWSRHSSTGQPVTDQDKESRADEIATLLGNHGHWLTHGRSIKMEDLRSMGVKIEDYSQDPLLADAIDRYYTLMHITFQTNIYKIFETAESRIFDFLQPPAPMPAGDKRADFVLIDFECPKCHSKYRVQANFVAKKALEAGCIPFPKDRKFQCPACSHTVKVSAIQRKVEAQTGRRIIL